MGQSTNAQRIRGNLAKLEGAARAEEHERMVTWLERFGPQLDADERRECRQALGQEDCLADIPFPEMVPEGWFKDLLEVQKESESPTPFYFLAGLTVFSQLVGRKVLIDRGNHSVGLDVSALLISPAGRGRRSTACDFVVYGIAERAGMQVIADSFTYEAFGENLISTARKKPSAQDKQAVGSQSLIYAGELSVLLGKGSYGDSIIPKLTDILGKTSRFNWQTVKRGKIEFVNPMVNALFTSSPDWLVDNIPAVAFGGGMLSRFLLCVREQPEQVVTWAQPPDAGAINNLVDSLRQLTAVEGVFRKPTGEAFRWYDKWYQQHAKATLNGELPDERMAPYYSRKHDHLLRMAALLTIAAGEELTFTVTRLEQALTILDWLELDVPKAYANMALNPFAAAQRMACKLLAKSSGLMEHTQLQRKMYRQLPMKEQFQGIMDSLIEMGVVRSVAGMRGKGRSYLLVRSLD